MCKKNERNCDNMPTLTRSVIDDTKAYMKTQKQYLKKLQQLQAKKERGENVDKEKRAILANLIDAGILDQNGELASPYRKDED